LSAEYKVTCANIGALDSLDVALFDVFPGTKQLKAVIVTPAGQSSTVVTPDARRVKLK
jgi:hypothetical protein